MSGTIEEKEGKEECMIERMGECMLRRMHGCMNA